MLYKQTSSKIQWVQLVRNSTVSNYFYQAANVAQIRIGRKKTVTIAKKFVKNWRLSTFFVEILRFHNLYFRIYKKEDKAGLRHKPATHRVRLFLLLRKEGDQRRKLLVGKLIGQSGRHH